MKLQSIKKVRDVIDGKITRIEEFEKWADNEYTLDEKRNFKMDKICDKCRTKKREEEELRSLKNRLSRIEGQVRGIGKMLDTDAYCTDILTQVSAINSALCAFSRELLANHIRTCVSEDIRAGKEETVDDLLDTIYKLMK